jgi:serine/threonine protein kinase
VNTETAAVVASRYRLEHRVDRGDLPVGEGEVWAATDLVLGRRVAVKLLRADQAEDPALRARFQAEARAAARLTHPGAAGVFDYGSHGTTLYLVMELVDGEPLGSALSRRGALDPAQAMKVVAQAASVLATARSLGLVHCDVSPESLYLQPDGRVKFAHFGIGHASGSTMEAGASDTADVHHLGMLAYRCLRGIRLCGPMETAELGIRRQIPTLPDGAPAAVCRFVQDLLSADARRHPSSAAAVAEIAEHLATSLAKETVASPRTRPVRRRRPVPARRSWPSAGTVMTG